MNEDDALDMTTDRAQATSADEEWTTIIRPHEGWLDLRLGELLQYRDLIYLFVYRDFVAQFKQTILGPAWHIVQPLLTTIMFTIVFGNIAKLSTDGVPPFLFYMAGTVIWTYFANVLTRTSDTFIANANIFGKVYFPRLVMPVATLVSQLIGFSVQFLFFLCFVAWYALGASGVSPNAWMLITPLLLLMMASLGMGLGIIISSLTTRYRDLKVLVSFGVQLAMYATPVVYPISTVPEPA